MNVGQACLCDCGSDGIAMAMAMVAETLRPDIEKGEQLAVTACRFGKDRGVGFIGVGGQH